MSTKKFTIKELKVRVNKAPFEAKGNRDTARRMYPEQLKMDIIQYHFDSGRVMASIGNDLGIIPQVMNKWKRVLGKERTVVIHGRGVRNDVRTKAMAVKKFIDGKTAPELSKEYNVAPITIYGWVRQYSNKFEEYIDLPDGVTVIAKEEKHIYGNKNIQEVEELLRENHQKLTDLINSQHYTKAEMNTLVKMRDKTNKKQKEVEELKVMADKLNIDIN